MTLQHLLAVGVCCSGFPAVQHELPVGQSEGGPQVCQKARAVQDWSALVAGGCAPAVTVIDHAMLHVMFWLHIFGFTSLVNMQVTVQSRIMPFSQL